MTGGISQMTTYKGTYFIMCKHSINAATKDNTIAEHKQKSAAICERTFQARQGLTKEKKFKGLMEQGVSWSMKNWLKPCIEQLVTCFKKTPWSPEENFRGSTFNLSTEWRIIDEQTAH